MNKLISDIRELLKKALDNKVIDALLLPVKVPAGDSYSWVILKDDKLLEKASPIPPVISVQGARAISSLTRRGKLDFKIATFMRPCEARATIELAKLAQADLDDVVLITFDCPGAIELKKYTEKPEEVEKEFSELMGNWESDVIRTICKMCDKFTCVDDGFATDLHIGLIGLNGKMAFIPRTEKGKKFLSGLGLKSEENLNDWEKKSRELIEKKRNKRKELQNKLKPQVVGLDALSKTFAKCINCRICRSVCPICYCRQCYFDSEKLKFTPDDYLIRAEKSGGIKFLPDTLLFHLGRMTHMALSCVSCGTCEDACPMDIKVAQIFSIVGDNVQKLFEYVPGRKLDEPLPLTVYKEEEFKELEV